MTDLQYHVTTPGSRVRRGSDSTGLTHRALADRIAATARASRPETSEILTIHVWTTWDGADVQRFDYPAAA